METGSLRNQTQEAGELDRLDAVTRDWDAFIEGVKENRLGRSITREGWDRCQSLGLSPDRLAFSFLTEVQLARKREANALLINVARPFLEELSLSLGEAPHLVVLSDAEGWILELHGPAEELGGRACGFAAGASWAESAIGNNGIGTALVKGEPVFVYGVEHFANAYGGWGCLGVPINDPDGAIAGAIDVSVPVEEAHPGRLTVALAVGKSIENALASARLERTEAARREQERFQQLALDAGEFGIWRYDVLADTIRFDERARTHY